MKIDRNVRAASYCNRMRDSLQPAHPNLEEKENLEPRQSERKPSKRMQGTSGQSYWGISSRQK